MERSQHSYSKEKLKGEHLSNLENKQASADGGRFFFLVKAKLDFTSSTDKYTQS